MVYDKGGFQKMNSYKKFFRKLKLSRILHKSTAMALTFIMLLGILPQVMLADSVGGVVSTNPTEDFVVYDEDAPNDIPPTEYFSEEFWLAMLDAIPDEMVEVHNPHPYRDYLAFEFYQIDQTQVVITQDDWPEHIPLDYVWLQSLTATAAFRGNGNTSGVAPANIRFQTPGSFTLPNQGSLARANHHFTGWRHATNGNIFQPGNGSNWPWATSGTYFFDALWTQQPRVTFPNQNQVIPTTPLTVTWQSVPGAVRYVVSVRNLNTGAQFINEHVSGTMFTIPQTFLVPGHNFRVAIGATRGSGSATWGTEGFAWYERYFSILAPTLSLDQSNWTAPAAGGSQMFTITTNQNILNVQISSNQSWLTLTGTGSNRFMNVTPNPNSFSRSAIVTVSVAGLTRFINVNQSAGHLSATPAAWSPPATISQQSLTISTNQPAANVSVTSSNTSWLTVSGAGLTRTLHATTNHNTTSRTATITVSAGNLTQNISVTQAAAVDLGVTPITWNAPMTGGSTNFTINTNQPIGNVISTSNNTSWLTVTGTGFTRTMTATVNNTGAIRNGSITVSVAGQTRTISVTQAANTATVTFNANGGTPTPANRTVSINTAIGTLPTVTRTGHIFGGWWTAQTGGTQINVNTIVTGNVTYFARWLSITNPGQNNPEVPHGENLSVVWNAIPGAAGYRVRLIPLTSGTGANEFGDYGTDTYGLADITPLFTSQIIPGTTTSIPHSNFAQGGLFMVEVTALGANLTTVVGVMANNFSVPRMTRINFQGGGHTSGTVPVHMDVRIGGSMILPQTNIERTNFVFGGWRDPGGTVRQPGVSYSVPANAPNPWTMTAHWVGRLLTRPAVLNPAQDGHFVAERDLNVSWSAVHNAEYYTLTLRNLTTGQTPLNNIRINGMTNTSLTIEQVHLIPNHEYELTIRARTTAGNQTMESTRRFVVNSFFAFYGNLGWRYPFNHPDAREITSGFRVSSRPNHEGIDIGITGPVGGLIRNEPVFAAHSGVVTHSGWFGTGGYTVIIRSHITDPDPEFPNYIRSRYMHMLWAGPDGISHRPALGSLISMGTQIGVASDTGGPAGQYHLHLDFSRGTTNTPSLNEMLNPQRFFPHIIFEANRFPSNLSDFMP